MALMLALYQRVAECLAEDGDEDPLPIRMSKAIGIIARPARLTDLLGRHAGDPDPHQEPWEQVAAHHADPTDPWAEDLRRPAGKPTGTATTTSPASMRTTGGTNPAPNNPPAPTLTSGTGRSIRRSTIRTWPGTSAATAEGTKDAGDQEQPNDAEPEAFGAVHHAEDDHVPVGDHRGVADDHRPTDAPEPAYDHEAADRDKPEGATASEGPRIGPAPISPLTSQLSPVAAAVPVRFSSGGRPRSGHPAGSPSPRPSSPPAHRRW